MKKKLLVLAVMLICAVFAFAACGDNTTAGGEENQTRTIVDMSGREVEIPMEVKTIINSWPSSNSVMLMIGAGDYLVGTSTATVNNKWNQFMYPNLVNIPTDISNTEDILKYEPDLYICNNADTADSITQAGVPAVNLTFSDYESMKKSFTILGEILGGEYVDKMAKWCDFVDEWTETITTRLADVAEEDKPILYYISSQSNAELTATFKSPSICQDWATICGTIYLNDLTDEPGASTITMEEILDINPDIIINGGIHQAASWEALQASELMAEVNAMKNGRAYLAPMGMHSFARFGIEAALMLPWTASTVWPEKFQDVDMRQLCFDFYKDFSGVELTDAQIENLLIGYAPDDPYGATAVAK